MEIRYAKADKNLTFQKPFPETTKCCICNKESRIIINMAEDRPIIDAGNKLFSQYLCDFHQNGEDNKYWFHDCVAFALYLCTDINCAKITTLYNQA